MNYFFLLLLGAAHLVSGVARTAPKYLSQTTAAAHVAAVQSVSTDVFSSELLLGLAWVESNFQPNATSRHIKGEKGRRTGLWNSDEKPPNSVGPYFCGVTQVTAPTWERCLELRKLEVAYATAVKELTAWYRSPPCRSKTGDNRLRCTLQGYGGGWQAIKANISTYPDRVMGQAALIRRAVQKAASVGTT